MITCIRNRRYYSIHKKHHKCSNKLVGYQINYNSLSMNKLNVHSPYARLVNSGSKQKSKQIVRTSDMHLLLQAETKDTTNEEKTDVGTTISDTSSKPKTYNTTNSTVSGKLTNYHSDIHCTHRRARNGVR